MSPILIAALARLDAALDEGMPTSRAVDAFLADLTYARSL